MAILFVFVCFNTANATTSISPHWKSGTIRVYIPQDTQATMMQHAFERWQDASSGKLSFVFINKGPADIDVIFADSVDGNDGPIGSYTVTIQNRYITKAEIKIATKKNNISQYSNDYIFTTMMHEVGHALGLPDTNRKASSIMYMPLSASQDLLKIDMLKLYNLNNWSWMDRNIQE